MSAHPEFATNRPEPHETVAGALHGLLGKLTATLKDPPELAIASAYFNVGGYRLLADALEAAGPVRLLLGSEPTDAQVRSTVTPLKVRGAHRGDPRVDEAVREHAAALAEERDLLGFGRQADADAERLIAWLRSGRVQVRRLTRGFLHGKAFIAQGGAHAVVAGSSNLTYAGLALNRELNLGVYQPSTVDQVVEWFDEQWSQAEPYDLAALYEARRVPHDPATVFLRMLWELYGGAELETDRTLRNELGLADFQADGVWRAKRILAERGGVIIADEVGLGKTFIAGELIREAVIERRQKVLVVGPATLCRATWEPILATWNLPATVISYEKLVRDLPVAGTSQTSLLPISEYAMVVVDEAHSLRNAATGRAEAMRELLAGPVAKQLVLLSATPVNNSLEDLRTLISYITPSDAAFADVDVPSLRQYFERAMALDPDELSGRHLFEVLDAVAVRRTRRFIKTQYPDATIQGQRVVFPQAVVHRVDYRLEAVLPGFFEDLARALGAEVAEDAVAPGDILPSTAGDVLTMARYVPSRYELGGEEVAQYQVQNAGLLQSALLKRFESSSVAFAKTVRTMIASHDHFLDALDEGWVLTGDALRAWVASDTDDVEDVVGGLDEEARDRAVEADRYDVEALRAAVESDRAILDGLARQVERVTSVDDPKIGALVDELVEIVEEARLEGIGDDDARDKRKVVIFTYFADTADYIGEALRDRLRDDARLRDYAERLVVVTGADIAAREAAITGFAPRSAGNDRDEDLYDIAVATDVLAEGVNLQQARHIINYDLPWNPMRLVQRHGRVDRIGSRHPKIFVRCFFPADELERLLQLEERLQRKIKQAAAAFGTDEVLPGTRAVERVMSETRAEIGRLRAEDASLFDDESDAAASSEEFQRRLEVALRSAQTKSAVLGLPWGAGTGVRRHGAQPGVVFCVRVADSPRPQFRYIPLTEGMGGFEPKRDGDRIEVRRELLVSLNQADPGMRPDPPDLPEPLLDAVFDAWPVAQRDVYDEWMRRTDPAVVQPAAPKVMRDAAALVRAHGAGLGHGQDELVERLGQEVERRLQVQVRAVLKEHADDPAVAVRELQRLADDARLAVPERPQPLPEIEVDDVRLVCWVAVHGGDA